MRETHFPMRIFFFFLADATGEDNEQGEHRQGIPDSRRNFRTLFAGRSGFFVLALTLY